MILDGILNDLRIIAVYRPPTPDTQLAEELHRMCFREVSPAPMVAIGRHHRTSCYRGQPLSETLCRALE